MPERDMESLGVMGWGLAAAENSSAAVVAAVALWVGGYPWSHGCSRVRLLYKATTTIQGYDYSIEYKATTTLQGYDYSTRLRLLYKATTILQGTTTLQGYDYYTRLRLLYYATTTILCCDY